ncbi:MAG: carbamoyltransferase HypF [Saccharofermentanales bacterium]
MTESITVSGIVQGVGYRPFVARLADEMYIKGTVMNCDGIVLIVASAESKIALARFKDRLKSDQPAGAEVTEIQARVIPEQVFEDFKIITSIKKRSDEHTETLISPDLPVCEKCLKELYDPDNRRYLYPFISCVACGPRYSIIKDIPYDRDTITMDIFPMCPECEAEYTDNTDRRRHAQTISCHDCGPQLILSYNNTNKTIACPEPLKKNVYREEALATAIDLIKGGNILAVKGIGGYHLTCLISDAKAIENLRRLKHRDKKPFAVMFPDLQSVREFCEVDSEEKNLMLSAARPIVLLRKKQEEKPAGRLDDNVCGDSRYIGAFLPYTPLHQLLVDACGPLVMTSANLTDDPIIYRDEDMLDLQSEYLAGILYNERRIVTPLDDSVAHIVNGKPQIIRRSRGYVPNQLPKSNPVRIGKALPNSNRVAFLALGNDLKSCFCLYSNEKAYISQYFGDMENTRVSDAYKENIRHAEKLFDIIPDIIACDMHPQYFTTRLAKSAAEFRNKELIQIQHHHAHAASVMAEHVLESCIGVVFDGTGYGTDGAIWGGEFLLCKGNDYQRRAHLGYVTLCGGDRVAKNASLAAQCYLASFIENEAQAALPYENKEFDLIRAAIKNNINTCQSSSMGRLFDAVSALLSDNEMINSFEGECAIALENKAAKASGKLKTDDMLHFAIEYNPDSTIIDQAGMFRQIYMAYQKALKESEQNATQVDLDDFKEMLALAFHKAIADMVVNVCVYIREMSNENDVALSGGVFANMLLLDDCISRLESAGFRVFLNSEIPANDGGICLGQAWLCRN